MKRSPKNAPTMPNLFGFAEAPVATVAKESPAASENDRFTIDAARMRLVQLGAPDLADCGAFVDGDTVRFFREQRCVATLTYNGQGHRGSWSNSDKPGGGWTTKDHAFVQPPAVAPEQTNDATSDDDRYFVNLARATLTSVGAVSMHQYVGWVSGDRVIFGREDGGNIFAWLSYDEEGAARGEWIVFTPVLDGAPYAEARSWTRPGLGVSPVTEFTSPKGRRFTVGLSTHKRANAADAYGCDTFPILFDGQPAGAMFRTDNYGKAPSGDLRWHASMNPLRWKPFVELPRGQGYDVAAFDTAAECLEAWARSADQIIDAQEARAQQEQATAPVPVCPRCLGIEPGKPGGTPDAPHPGPFTADLCAECQAATPPPSPKRPAARPAVADDLGEPGKIALEIVESLTSALVETRKMVTDLSGVDDIKGPPIVSLVVQDGTAVFFAAENPPVHAVAVLWEFRKRHPVSYSELYDLALEMGSPPVEDTGDIGDKLTKALGRANERSKYELDRLREIHAEVIGCPVEELDERMAEGKRSLAAAGKRSKAQRPSTRARRGAAHLPPPPPAAPVSEEQAHAAAERLEATVATEETADDAGSSPPACFMPAIPSNGVAMRKLTARQQELLSIIYVDEDRAIFGSDEHVDDWDALKKVMVALGGTWRKGSKKFKAGFIFPEGTDVVELIRLAKATGEILDPRLVGFVPTPAPLADLLVEWVDPQPGDVILEPEAGTGRIVEAVRRAEKRAHIACYELLETNREVLSEMAEDYGGDDEGDLKILGDNFLSADPSKSTAYDGCAMNPPFEKGADIRHVRHAIRFVKTGKHLAAIVSAGAMFRSDKAAVEFRAFVAQHGTIEALPDGSFAAEGTGVRTAIVRLTACPSCSLDPANHARPLF